MRGPGRVNPNGHLFHPPEMSGADQRGGDASLFSPQRGSPDTAALLDCRGSADAAAFPSVRTVLLATAESPCFHSHSLSGAVWGSHITGAAISESNWSSLRRSVPPRPRSHPNSAICYSIVRLLGGGRALASAVAQRLVNLACHPQPVQQYGQFARYRHRRRFFAFFDPLPAMRSPACRRSVTGARGRRMHCRARDRGSQCNPFGVRVGD